MKTVQTWFKRRFYSLPARIVRVFVVQALVTMLLLAMVAVFVVKKNNQERIPLLLENYLQHLVTELPAEPDAKAFAKLQQETGLFFGYQERGEWLIRAQEGGFCFEDEKHEDWKTFKSHPNWRWDIERGRLVVTMPYHQGTLWVHLGFRHDGDGLAFWLSVSIIGLMLLLTYLWVRRLVSPIKRLEIGVQKYAEGEFSYRLPVEGKGDLSALSSTVNQMAQQIEDRLQKNRELFLAMSHELRTPLARLRLALEMQDDSEDKVIMQRSQQDMEAMIDALLLREQLQEQQRSVLEPVNDLMVREWVLSDFTDQTDRILFNLPSDLKINVDAFALRLLLKNLISNALKYGLDNPVSLNIKKDQSLWYFEVEDQGVGVREEDAKDIFEPFYRVDQARSRQTGGFGLGLYLAQMLAKQLRCKIMLDSEPEKGSRFYFILPAVDSI